MFEYGQIIEYVDATFDENFNNAFEWCRENNATFDELIEERKNVEVEKTRTVETYEEKEQVVPAEYDEEGNLIKEETTEIVQVPVTKEETYTEIELHRFFKINEIPAPVIPEPTIDELKAQKRAEINQVRDLAEQSGFEYMGKMFDSDQVSCIRISSAAQAMSLADDTTTITWTTQDNSTIDLNKAQLMGLVVALAKWSNECHQKATALKAQIEEAKTKEELDKITWYEEESNSSDSVLMKVTEDESAK